MPRTRWIPLLLVLLGTSLLASSRTRLATADPPEVEWHPDLVFGKGGEEELQLDLARPALRAAPLPAIVVLHGGGWAAGSRKMHSGLLRRLAREGFVAIASSYRFAPKNPWPAQIEDAKCAVRWLRANAGAWGVDPDRVGAVGFSAGAHLAMLLGTMDPSDGAEGEGGNPGVASKVEAVVSFFGPTDLAADDIPEAGRRIVGALLGERFRSDPGRASPIRYVDGKDAPMLLFQGTRDRLVAPSQAVRMADALTEGRVDGRVVLLLGAGHGWGEPLLGETLDEAVGFLRTRLAP